MRQPRIRKTHCWSTSTLVLLLALGIGPFPAFCIWSRTDDDPNALSRLSSGPATISLSSYIQDYLGYIKQKPDDWYACLPRKKQELLVSALTNLAKNAKIKTGFETEQPLGKDCIEIKTIRRPWVLKDGQEGQLEKFSLKVSANGADEVEVEGTCDVTDAGSTVEHNCAMKGTSDIAYLRYKLTLTICGGGLDLKKVTIDNHKKYLVKFKP